MSKKFAVGLGSAIAFVALSTGCWKEPATSPTATAPEAPAAAAPAASTPSASTPSATAPSNSPASVDPVAAADLKAGLVAITPRIVATVDGYQKVEPRQDDRFAMHPDAGKIASIEFDVKGLQSLTLSPYMADFSSVVDCNGNPQAGVVRMRWSLDGGANNDLTIDRTYAATINVDVSKASRLKIEADEGNGVPYCDWFGVGIVNVK